MAIKLATVEMRKHGLNSPKPRSESVHTAPTHYPAILPPGSRSYLHVHECAQFLTCRDFHGTPMQTMLFQIHHTLLPYSIDKSAETSLMINFVQFRSRHLLNRANPTSHSSKVPIPSIRNAIDATHKNSIQRSDSGHSKVRFLETF